MRAVSWLSKNGLIMRFGLRTLLIVLAIGLALLQFVVFLIPYNGETTELTAWFLCLDFVSYVVPLVQISALAIALTIGNGSSSNNQSPVPILRFTIRDVLWLTVVVGMSVAWWLGQEKNDNAISRIRNSAPQMAALGGASPWPTERH